MAKPNPNRPNTDRWLESVLPRHRWLGRRHTCATTTLSSATNESAPQWRTLVWHKPWKEDDNMRCPWWMAARAESLDSTEKLSELRSPPRPATVAIVFQAHGRVSQASARKSDDDTCAFQGWSQLLLSSLQFPLSPAWWDEEGVAAAQPYNASAESAPLALGWARHASPRWVTQRL